MQLDRTEIVIRQRSASELLDMSLRVLRRHGFRVAAACAIFGVPLLVADVLLSSWMFGEDALMAVERMEEPELYLEMRFELHLLALFLFQFPLISLPATILLGDKVFFEAPTFWQLLKKLRSIWFEAIWVLGICRMGLLSLLLAFMVDRSVAFDPVFELLMLLLLAIVLIVRAVWPFAPEIIGLERCRLWTTKEAPINYAKRRSGLHQSVSADHTARFIIGVMAAMILWVTLVALVLIVVSTLFGTIELGNEVDSILSALLLWSVGLYMVVYRFLCYLDSRIRLEGWELELRLRAEGQRVQATLNPNSVETVSNPEQVAT